MISLKELSIKETNNQIVAEIDGLSPWKKRERKNQAEKIS